MKSTCIINKHNKWNLTNKNGNILSNVWFDQIIKLNYTEFSRFRVYLNNKCNIINIINNDVIYELNKWFECVGFGDGCLKICLNNNIYKLDMCGNITHILNDKDFYKIDYYEHGYTTVIKNEKYNFINKYSELISNFWYDHIFSFLNGFIEVRKNGKYNIINLLNGGRLISNIWFDRIKHTFPGEIIFFLACLNDNVYKIDLYGNIKYTTKKMNNI